MQTSSCSKSITEIAQDNAASAIVAEAADRINLQLAFSKFTEASSRLERKYEVLRLEAEDLRARLKEKDAEIARTARLAMLGETAAAIAHEVRNPLGSIKLFASLLKQDLLDKPQSLELLEGIDKSLAALDNVVSNILHFTRRQEPKLAPVNLHSIIKEQVQTLAPSGKSELRFVLDLQGAPFVGGNEHGLRQVFYNLMLNAVQAMRGKGEISVAARSTSEGALQIVIKDTGPGIAPELLGRIFDPFVTSKNEGTGLGLAIVKKILGQHNGTIEAGNDGGAVFTVTLPQKIKEERK